MTIYLHYVLLLVILFYGAKVYKKGQWNADALSIDQTKAVLGFCAIVIMYHHISHKTCMDSIDPQYFRPGLEFFIRVGFICVGAFFFCSGYGMYSSYKSNALFFKNYFTKRMPKIIIPALVMWLTFFFIERAKGMTIEPPVLINVFDYVWYVPAILYAYVLFYIAFNVFKDEDKASLVLWGGVVIWTVICFFISPGPWWYNTLFMFPIGIAVARDIPLYTMLFKKHFYFWIVAGTVIGLVAFNAAWDFEIRLDMHIPVDNRTMLTFYQVVAQMISVFFLVWVTFLLGMKVRIGNRILSFCGNYTLEIYLVHPLFVHLFGYHFVQKTEPPLYFIYNQHLYIAAVILPTIPIAYVLHKAVNRLFEHKENKK